MEQITLTRKQLYDLVWSQSLLSLSKKYNISDVGLRKICIRRNIPLPNKSYWRRIQGGKSVLIKSLPRDYSGKNEVVLNLREDNKNDIIKEGSSLKALIKEIENDKELSLKVADRLTDPNALVIEANKRFSDKPRSFSRFYGIVSTRSGSLTVEVTPANLPRALRIFDAIIKLFRSRNHDIIVDYGGTYFIIGEEKIRVSLKEKLTMVKSEKSGDRQFKASGKLSFRIEGYKSKMWFDDKNPLEDQLARILAFFEIEAERLKKERLLWEERNRIREEQERVKREERERKEHEIAKFNDLLKQANQWHQAMILRNFINAVEAKMLANGNLTSENSQWLQWAKVKAKTIDPINSF